MHWFSFRHFTVLKDINTEYFIQMNKARLCCTFIFLMVVYECSSHYFDFFCSMQFHMLMKKVVQIFCHVDTLHAFCLRHIAKDYVLNAHPFLQVNDCTFEPSFRYTCFFWSPFNFCFHIHVFLQNG